jgi:hypothetical protein
VATKKKSLSATERHRADVVEARETFRATVTAIAAEELVFVDESGITTKREFDGIERQNSFRMW